MTDAGIQAPVMTALARLISGELPLDEWIAIVRTTLPPPPRWRPTVRPGFWKRVRERIRNWFRRHRHHAARWRWRCRGDSDGSGDVRALTSQAQRPEYLSDGNSSFTPAEGGDGTVSREHSLMEEEHAADHRDG